MDAQRPRAAETVAADDRAAVAQVLAGDRDAFRSLVERHSRSIFRLSYRMLGSESDAEEAVQETLLRAYTKLGSFKFESSFKTWLFRIAANYCLDVMAKRKHEQPVPLVQSGNDDEPERELDLPAPQPGPERLLLSGEVRRAVAHAFSRLTAQERVAFTMRHFEECSIEEIAEVLKVKPGAVKNTVFRATQKMRGAVGPLVLGAVR
jgi:RNA polymerase sigma-70 factor (ECF subfamily)